MLSRLDPVFAQMFRPQAEPVEARLIVRREAEDRERKRSEQGGADPDAAEEAESVLVSVEVLHSFLKALLDRESREPATNEPRAVSAGHGSVNPLAEQAARAYRQAADTAARRSEDRMPAGMGGALSGQERRDLMTLLSQVAALLDKGVRDIRIERRDSLIGSLQEAVARAGAL